jgi:hypothetical protein
MKKRSRTHVIVGTHNRLPLPASRAGCLFSATRRARYHDGEAPGNPCFGSRKRKVRGKIEDFKNGARVAFRGEIMKTHFAHVNASLDCLIAELGEMAQLLLIGDAVAIKTEVLDTFTMVLKEIRVD